MTRSPHSGKEQGSSNRRLWLLILGRTSIALGVILLVGIAGGAWWARNFIYNELAPLVGSSLKQLLGRPIEIGKVERFSFNSLRFNSLSIPATPTDPDRVKAKAVEVEFSPLQLLVNRTLQLNVTLVEPNVYIEQEKNSRWVSAQIKIEEQRGFIQIDLQSLQIQNANVELAPTSRPGRPKGTVALDRVSGTARFLDQNQRISYELSAQPTTGGKVKIAGETRPAAQQTNLLLQAQIQATDVSRLVELPAIALLSGSVDANLAVQFQPNQPETSIIGTANLNQIAAQINNIPQKVTNTKGRLIFQGQQITAENLSTDLGKIPVQVNGAINAQTGYNVKVQVKAVNVKNILDTVNVKSPVAAVGEVRADIQVQGPIKQPILTGSVSTTKPAQVDRVTFNAISSRFRVKTTGTASEIALSDIQLTPTVGGQIAGSGQIQLGRQSSVKVDLQALNLPGNAIAQAYGFSSPINVGNVSANAKISGSLGNQPLILALNNIQVNPTLGGEITGSGQIQLASQGRVELDVQAQVPGNAIAQAYGVSTPINVGNVSANAKISGSLGNQPLILALNNIRATPEVGGQIAASGQVQLAAQGRVLLNVQAANVPGDAIAKAYNVSPAITIGNVSANAKISGALNNLRTVAQLQAPTATYPSTGQVVITTNGGNIQFQDAVVKVAGGTVRGRGQLAQDRWQAFVDAEQIRLSSFAQIPPQFQGLLSSELNLSGTTASFQPSAIQATGQASLNVASGTVNLRNVNLNAGRWQAVANISQLQLNRFSNQLQGRLSSELSLAGITDSFQLSDIRAAGQVRLSQASALLQQPLQAQVQWNGEQIIVQRATTSGISANGAIALQLQGETPQIAGFNLNVQANGYNLQNSPVSLPNNVALAGRVDFTGQITGTPTAPNAVGNLRLRNLGVNGLAFDPVLAGEVNFQAGQGAQVQLAGSRQDQIALTLDPNNRPTSFLVRRDGAVATGKSEGDNLLVNVQDFPVAVLQSLIPSNKFNLEPVAGNISGNLVANLAESTAVGDVAIAQPQIGRIIANEFRGRLSYANGAATLTNGELRLGESRISLSGNVQTGNNPQFQAQVNFDQARINNLLQAFSIFNFQDISPRLQSPKLARAEVLQTVPVSLPSANLLTQLQRFSEIEAQVAQQRTRREEAQTLPTLAELQGALSGEIAVTGSLRSGLNANFNILGSNWKWGDYNIDEVIARGNFADGVLTLQPLRVDLREGLLAFSGQLGNEQFGQLQLQSLPVALLQPFLEELPVDITGQLNANATLAGSLKNPTAIGDVTLVNGSLNKQPVQRAQLGFNYNNARLNFDSSVLVTGTQPVQITGSIPAALRFAEVKPDSNQISINAAVQDEGLALLNLFSDQVSWVEGQGQVNVEIRGTLNQPTVTGKATVNNATFRAQALPEPLTNVTGTLQFNRDRITVEGIQGQYNQGELTALGVIPIFANQQAQQQAYSNPLTVSLNNLALNLQGLYEGGVSGNVVIRGTALDPEIGGVIQLANGRISLAQSQNAAQAAPKADSATDSVITRESANANSSTAPGADSVTDGANTLESTPRRPPIDLANLRLILDDNIRVIRQPLLSFLAKGELNINGTLANPRPQGVIRLTGGQVNLFTTQFTLVRGYEQTARFTPSRGLDPSLDVRLVAIVPETSGGSNLNRTLTDPFSSEVEDVPVTSDLGTLRTVRVQARATGPASELDQNLVLTSEPRRSEAEIVSLLGGSIINTLGQVGQGDATLGIASIAGSTLLNSLQGRISALGEAIGLREFRLFPTLVSNNEDSDDSTTVSVLGLAAEGVFDIGNDFSVSLSRVFAANEPLRYNVLYRANDEVLVRGSTDLSEESRVLVEYETRF